MLHRPEPTKVRQCSVSSLSAESNRDPPLNEFHSTIASTNSVLHVQCGVITSPHWTRKRLGTL